MPHSNPGFAVALELGDVHGYRIFQGNPAGFDQLHNAGGRGNDFGEGRKVEYRIDCHRLKLGYQRAPAESLAI